MDSEPESCGPNRLADTLRDQIDAANAELEEWPAKPRRRELNKEIHRLKEWVRWCETRAGYVAG
jgi:hypothetical protein